MTNPTHRAHPEDSGARIANTLLNHPHSHIEVTAVPGAGKTELLMDTLKQLIIAGVSPSSIPVLGFATETVRVLDQRREKLLSTVDLTPNQRERLQAISCRTMHSFALDFLSKSEAVSLLEGDEAARGLMERALRNTANRYASGRYGEKLPPQARQRRVDLIREMATSDEMLDALLSAFKLSSADGSKVADLIDGESPLFQHRRWLFRLRDTFKEAQSRAGKRDFAGILELCTQKLAQRRTGIRFVLVDEYQDCSRAQTKLLEALAVHGAQIAVFGDPDQAIYGFGGARYTPLAEILEGVQTIAAKRSHRFPRQIAALLNGVMGHETQAKIVGARDGERPRLIIGDSYLEQCDCVAKEVQGLLSRGFAPSQIAVLARTNLQLNDVESALLAVGIGSDRTGRLKSDPHVEQVLRLVLLVRRKAKERGGIGAEDVVGCWRTAAPSVEQAAAALRKLRLALRHPQALPERRGESIGSLYSLCKEAYLQILMSGRVLTRENRTERTAALTALNPYAPLAHRCSSPKQMIEELRALDRCAIVTSTINRAKGREWKHVLVVGVTDGVLPIYHVKENDLRGLQEERRLLYVALSRPTQTLTLFHCPKPHARTRQFYFVLSRFLSAPDAFESLDVELPAQPEFRAYHPAAALGKA